MKRWFKWALGEAGTRTFTSIIAKIVGQVASNVAHTFWAVGIVGIIQTIVGAVTIRARGERLFFNWREVSGAITFGINALIATVLGYITFLLGADLGVRTLIITLGIIPGALIDRIFFRNKLVPRQWLGLVIGLSAGYAVLGTPSFKEVLVLPVWVWLAAINSLVVAINQGVTQAIKNINPLRKNFWGGTVALIGLPVALILARVTGEGAGWDSKVILTLSGLAAVNGLSTVLLWTFNILSYRDGAHIAFKKLVVMGTYLIASMISGVVFFQEVFTTWKAVGVILFFVTFVLMDQATWQWLTNKVLPAKSVSGGV